MTNTMPKNYAETILNDKNLTSDEKFQRINFVYNNYQEKLDEDLQNFLLKKWAGAALEIGSAAIPFGGTGKLGATAGQKLLQKAIGRKLSQEIGSGTASGLASGAVFGTGRGLIEDKNPLITGLQDATGGLAAGALIGGTGGYLEKSVRANLLENAKPLSELSQTQIKNLIKQGKNYYQDYLHDTHVYYPPLDKIYFRNSQAGEIRPHNMKMVPKIPEQIRTSYGLKHSNDKPWRQDANNFYKLYNTHKGKTYEYIIRNNANKTGNDFYQIKEVDSAPAYLHHNQALETEPVNIINDNSGNINPVPMIIPPQVLQNLQDNNIPSLLLEGGVEMNVDTNGNQIFTPQDIGEMTPDEFQENIQIIEQQLKDGLIKPQTHQVDYSGYVNPETGDGKIFSREAISQMTSDEYTGNESAIMAQLKSIGIPYESDLELAGMRGAGVVYVKPYIRSDGTEVRGHWRSAPAI